MSKQDLTMSPLEVDVQEMALLEVLFTRYQPYSVPVGRLAEAVYRTVGFVCIVSERSPRLLTITGHSKAC